MRGSLMRGSFRGKQAMDRRMALQWLASGMVVATGTSVKACHHTVEEEGCTLGFSTYGMKSLKTEQAIDHIREIGFDSFEMTVWQGWDADSEKMGIQRRRNLRKRIMDSGLVLTSLMEHVSLLDAKRQKNAIRRLKEASDLAHDLVPESPPLIQTVLGGGRFEENKNEVRDRLEEWVRLTESCRATIAIKPHRGGVVSKPAEATWLFEQLGQPKRLRMVYDYSHYAYRKMTIEKTIETALPYIAHVAVKDAVQGKDNRVVFQLPGEAGTIDFAKIIRLLHAGGYRADINCEVSGMVWSKSEYDPVAAARKCYAVLAKAFRDAGVERRNK